MYLPESSKKKGEELDKLPAYDLAVAGGISGVLIKGGFDLRPIGVPMMLAGAILMLYSLQECERRNALVDSYNKDLRELKEVQKKEDARMQDIIAKLKDMKFEEK